MKKILFVFWVLIIGCTPALEKKSTIPIIFDTDMGPDYDDAGAIAMLHAYADSGLIEILACMSSNRYTLSAPAIDVFNHYFGRPNIPIGAPKTNGVTIDCWQHWTDSITATWPHRIKSTEDAEDAVQLYRKILSSQEDTSVVIVTVGFLTNVSNLLSSQPDTISPLNGLELINKKVKHFVCMAGKFPQGKEFNVIKDSVSSVNFFTNCPRPIIFTGFEIGVLIKVGTVLIKSDINSPVKQVFKQSMFYSHEGHNWGDSLGRCSWDETAVMIGAKGIEPFFTSRQGKIIVKESGENEWLDDANGNHFYIKFKTPVEEVNKSIEKIIQHVPIK